jgi:hypothetical protein
MERATRPADEHADAHPAPVPRDPDLPTVSDTTLMLFAAVALVVTALALIFLARLP